MVSVDCPVPSRELYEKKSNSTLSPVGDDDHDCVTVFVVGSDNVIRYALKA